MNQHVIAWLGAYHDGELKGARLWQVEAHLQSCESCRAELDRLRALGHLLQASPPPEGLTPAERFEAQVRLRLPPRPARTTWQSALETGWQLAPLGLFVAWGFVQAVFLVSGAVLVALRAGLGGPLAAQWLPSTQELWLAQIFRSSTHGLEVGPVVQFPGDAWLLGLLGWSFALEMGLLVVIGLLYWSWLASWWVRQQHRPA